MIIAQNRKTRINWQTNLQSDRSRTFGVPHDAGSATTVILLEQQTFSVDTKLFRRQTDLFLSTTLLIPIRLKS